MRYKILTHEEFDEIHAGKIVSIQKYSKDKKSITWSHYIESYKITVGDILCIGEYINDEINGVILFFVDDDCVIEFVDYDAERERRGGKESEIYDLTKDNDILTFKEAFEIAAL